MPRSEPRPLRGAIAAAVTPLRDDGGALDEDAFGSYIDFLVAGGLDGILALGTTGEGILLAPDERERAAELFIEASAGRFAVAVQCGAQSTADTVALAAHAAEHGADAAVVIGPPYFPLDEESLLRHFRAAAEACAPLPFYVYEFADRTGYAVPVGVVDRLRDAAPNLAGLKVSDYPFDRVEPYLLDGLDVFVGAEPLILEALDRGAAGAVSGVAAAFPELVAALVHEKDGQAGERVTRIRMTLQGLAHHAALKLVLGKRGVPVREDVRPPLRGLTDAERSEVEALVQNGSGSGTG